jgi:predicted nucleic acid-binding protein
MTDPYIDTNILIRYLTKDDPEKQERAAALLQRVEKGQLHVIVPLTVVSETVFVLASPRNYGLPREEIVALLTPILKLTNLRLENRRLIMRALDLYATSNRSFGDCLIAASMYQSAAKVIYSFDTDFDRLPGITRQEP